MKNITLISVCILLLFTASLNAQVYDYWEDIYSGAGVQDIEIAPDGRVYILDMGKFKYSDDFGETWQQHSIVGGANRFVIDGEGNLVCANNSTVYRCLAGDSVWQAMNFPSHNYDEIQINSAGYVFVSFTDTIFYSDDDGATYTVAYDSAFWSWGVTDSASIFVQIDDYSATKSFDLGQTWDTFWLFHPIKIFTSPPSHLVVTRWNYEPFLYNTLVVSNDNSVSWEEGPSTYTLDWARIDPATKQFVYCNQASSPAWDWLRVMDNISRESHYIGFFDSFRTHAAYGDYHFVFGDGKIWRNPRITPPAAEDYYISFNKRNIWQYVKSNGEIIECAVSDSLQFNGNTYYRILGLFDDRYVRYDDTAKKMYFTEDSGEYLYMDFYAGDHDVLYHVDPSDPNSTKSYRGKSGTINIFGSDRDYKGFYVFNYTGSGYNNIENYDFFVPGIGAVSVLRQSRFYSNGLELVESIVHNGADSAYWTNNYTFSMTYDTTYITGDYLFQIDSLKLQHEFNDEYGYSAGLYYFDSVWVEKAYIKGNDTLKQGKEFLSHGDDYLTHPCSFPVDSTLLQSGYYFAYAIGCTDKALIPNTKRYPETGYFINGQMTGLEDNETGTVPTQFALYQNYPNPFNPSTTIRFSLPEAAEVNLTVYDVTGNKVEVLVSELMQAGTHTVKFTPENLASGVYLYKLTSSGYSSVKKLLFMK